MKRTLMAAFVAAVSLSAHAGQTVATIENNAGGKIELTFDVCSTSNAAYAANTWFMYTWGRDGRVTNTGCWSYDDNVGVVRARWNTGEFAAYSDVKLTKAGMTYVKPTAQKQKYTPPRDTSGYTHPNGAARGSGDAGDPDHVVWY